MTEEKIIIKIKESPQLRYLVSNIPHKQLDQSWMMTHIQQELDQRLY